MNKLAVRFFGMTALAGALAFAFGTLPASAQYANEFSPAKLIKQGKTDKDIAGSGRVIVQVQVNADGSHKALKIIKSTNSGDNAAAMDIAQRSSYRPAHRGTHPIAAFYDFTLKFIGKTVQNSESSSGPGFGSVSPAASKIATLIRNHDYAKAKTDAQMALLSAPSDDSLREMLGIAAYDAADFSTAAAAFDRVASVGKQFRPIAAQSLAAAAVQEASANATQALSYAQKAMALDPSSNSQYALGVAQLANGQYADAIATLKAVHATTFADPKAPKNVKEAIDASLLSAYIQTKDTADAAATAAEAKQIDPTSAMPARILGNSLLKAGVDAATAKNYDEAFKDFDQAAAQGDPDVAVTADVQAAFLITKSDKPDYKKMQAYADKALALKPDDAHANFAEGIALTGQWAASRDDATKKKALAALTKADTAAKTAGDEALALSIETFIKQSLGGGAAGAPAGRR